MARFLPVLLALAFACGETPPAPASPQAAPRDPYAGSPLVGQWSRGDRTLEFIADGTLVELVEFDAQRSTRLDDGTMEEETVSRFRCDMGSYRIAGDRVEYELTEVAATEHVSGTWTWKVEGTSLTLEEDGEVEELERDELPDSGDAQPLVGLWRRVSGNPDTTDMGIRFTPGGLSILIGRNARWGNGVGATVGWLCMFATYEVDGENLREVRPNDPDSPRARVFKLDGDRLAFGTLVYGRIHGVVPLKDGKLDVAAWRALK